MQETGPTMRVLFVTPTLPIPTTSGGARAFNLIRELADRHEVFVLSFIQPSEHSLLPALEPYCKSIELVPFEGFKQVGKWRNRIRGWRLLLFSSRPQYVWTFPVERMRKRLERLVQTLDLDVVHFEHLYLVELLPALGDLPAVLGEQNVEFEVIRKLGGIANNPVHKVRDYLAYNKMRSFETHWVPQFPVCLAVSEQDANLLKPISGETELHLVPNGVDSRAFAPPKNEFKRCPNSVLFFGTLNYGPNRDGIIYFCENIWPAVHATRPDTTLEIIGINPTPDILALSKLPGVVVTGFVPDIRPKLWTAAISVVPLQWGGGTRLKILEALAAGCPTISTSLGAEGLDLREQQEIVIADTPHEFAQGVIDLLAHPDKRATLSAAGRRAVATRYDWGPIARRLEAAYLRAIELKHRNPSPSDGSTASVG
jgi:glycosyltransferase involved in cell wall biosynthesis